MTILRFRLEPISAGVANQLRLGGGPAYVADEHPGFPCRQCLHDAEIGEELILVSHDPFSASSPYRCASPIFLHRHDCGPYEQSNQLPEQLTRRQLSVRAFDNEAMMIDAAIIDGQTLLGTIERLLDNPSVASLHVHNAIRGCWATTVSRQ